MNWIDNDQSISIFSLPQPSPIQPKAKKHDSTIDSSTTTINSSIVQSTKSNKVFRYLISDLAKIDTNGNIVCDKDDGKKIINNKKFNELSQDPKLNPAQRRAAAQLYEGFEGALRTWETYPFSFDPNRNPNYKKRKTTATAFEWYHKFINSLGGSAILQMWSLSSAKSKLENLSV